jgi:flagellar motility protein MotE (MotC chaperone)
MMRSLRDVRLVPVVLVAAGALFVLKFTGLVTEGSYTLGAGHRAKADRIAYEAQLARDKSVASKVAASNPLSGAEAIKQAWSKETLNYQDVTGSVGATKPAEKKDGKPDADKKDGDKKEATKPIEPKKVPDGVVIPIEPKPVSPAERALLERLTERRQELDARERELSVRETLLQAQEKKQEAEVAKLKSLVTMYENMKAKEAAKIFERLEIRLATEVANQIAPRRMSDILAQMTPESAERLTVELANKNSADKPQAPDLPKIDGKPGG